MKSSSIIQDPRTSNTQLLVRMAFPKKQRTSKALLKARNEIQSLKKSIYEDQKEWGKTEEKVQKS